MRSAATAATNGVMDAAMTGRLSAGERLVPPDPTPQRPTRGVPPRPPRGPRRLLRRVAGGVLALALLVVAVGGFVAWRAYESFAAGLPTVATLRSYQPPVMSRVYSGNSELLAELANERRIFVPYSAIPKLVSDAFISAEDQNFWVHGGIDPLAILRAAVTDLRNLGTGRRPIGASTIAQQVAKNMLLHSDAVSLRRKVREAILAIRMEQVLSKQKVLEIYLNEIYLGLGAYGVAAAAQTYFNKPLDQLTVAEAAFLGALPKAPNNYNPYKYPQAALDRRNWVLDRMVDTGSITRAQADAAKQQPLVPTEFHKPATVAGADWFTSEVKRELVAKFGAEQTNEGGLSVQTSLDPRLQNLATDALRGGLEAYDRSHGGWRGPVGHIATGDGAAAAWAAGLAAVKPPPGMLPGWHLAVVLHTTPASATLGWLGAPGAPPGGGVLALGGVRWARRALPHGFGPVPRRITDVVDVGDVVMVSADASAKPGAEAALTLRQIPKVEGAMVAMDPVSGRVLALVGGWSYDQSQFNRAVQAERQPGSSFKPMVYLTAMEQGISPSQQFLDAPFVLGDWRPNNYEMNFGGPTPLAVAISNSLNLVTVRLAAHLGMAAVAKTAIAFHMNDSMPLVLPASLGAVDTTVLREAGAYASLAEDGREVIPTLIDTVQDPEGKVVWQSPTDFSDPSAADPNQPPQLVDLRRQIADPDSTFQITTMLEPVLKWGTGAAHAGLGIDFPAAAKTGTSQDFNDAWLAGYTPGLVCVVWVGFDQPATLGDKQTGDAAAGPIWNRFMREALAKQPRLPFVVPPGVTMARWSGGGHQMTDAFKPGQVPGASTGGGGGTLAADSGSGDLAAGGPTPGGSSAGVDSGLGGLY